VENIKSQEIHMKNRFRSGALRRCLMALALYALCLTPALAYFKGKSIYQFELYTYNMFGLLGDYDPREYTDLDVLCKDAAASWAQASERDIVLIDRNEDPYCKIEWKTNWGGQQQVHHGQIPYKAVKPLCPDHSTGYITLDTWCSCDPGYSEFDSACLPQKTVHPFVVGFFNGVWNTENQADDGLKALKEIIGLQYAGHDLYYKSLYNQTGSVNGNTPLQDIAEVFIQRGNELDGVLSNRWDYFWELLSGRQTAANDQIITDYLNGEEKGVWSAFTELLGATFNDMRGAIASGISKMLSNPPTEEDIETQSNDLLNLAHENYSFALIAHSQGNLFVNTAYYRLISLSPNTKVGVIHIAPASPTLRGEYLLADIDLVINALRIQGSSSVPPNNINLPVSTEDLSGHTLIGTYLDPARAAREKVKSMVEEVLLALSLGRNP
jgi:hypothetical protein